MNHRQAYAPFVYILAIFVFANIANAQSKVRDNPTKLTSNEISGLVDSESRGNFYYYSFMVNPGEVSLTLTVEPGRKSNDSDFIAFTDVSFSLFDRNAQQLAGKGVSTANEQGSKQAVARVEITRRQLVVLSIHISEGRYESSVGGRYRLRIEGAVDLGQNGSAPISTDGTSSSGCLPKQGTMIIKMKDGSKTIVDLSETETITVVP